MEKFYADGDILEFFFRITPLSAYRISKDTGVHERTVGKLLKHEADIGNLTLRTASILTAYAGIKMSEYIDYEV